MTTPNHDSVEEQIRKIIDHTNVKVCAKPDCHELLYNTFTATQKIQSLITLAIKEARLAEANWWEYNVIPAVRNPQVEKDVQKRIKELEGKDNE